MSTRLYRNCSKYTAAKRQEILGIDPNRSKLHYFFIIRNRFIRNQGSACKKYDYDYELTRKNPEKKENFENFEKF